MSAENQTHNISSIDVHNPNGRDLHAIEVRGPEKIFGMVVIGMSIAEEEHVFPELIESPADADDEPHRAAG